MKTLIHNWGLLLYIGLCALLFAFYATGGWTIRMTPWGVVIGTLYSSLGSLLIAGPLAYLLAAVLCHIFPTPPFVLKSTQILMYIFTGLPSILVGIIGYLVFSLWCGLGWSIAATALTLGLLILSTLVTGFLTIIAPAWNNYAPLCRSLAVSRWEFLLRIIPSMYRGPLISVLSLGWGRSIADTAAVMLTCGAVLLMPTSVFDSSRALSFHIYLLAMDVPGGLPEARTLSALLILALLLIRCIAHFYLTHRRGLPCQR